MKTGWITQSDTEYFGRLQDMNASYLAKIYNWQRFLEPSKSVMTKSIALLTGTAFHLAVLQPEIFRKYVQIFKGKLNTKEGKKEYQDLQDLLATQPEAFIINHKDVSVALDMAEAVNNNSEAQEILRGCVNEQAGYRKLKFDTLDGITSPEFAKIKLDARKKGIIIDLKSTTAKNRKEIQQAVEDYHYDMKAAYYLNIANAIEQAAKSGISYERFIWIFATKTSPSECVIYEASDEDLQIGRQKYLNAYQILKNYYETGKTDTVLDCPTWKTKKYDHYLKGM